MDIVINTQENLISSVQLKLPKLKVLLMKEQMESLDKYERAVYVIMQNSRYDSNIINLSMSVKILLYDIKLKKERYPVSENLCLRRECKTTNKGNIPDPKLCDSMIKSVCYLRKPSIYKTVILSMTNEW